MDTDLCSNGKCFKMVQTFLEGPPVFLSVVLLVGILVDEQFGWRNILEKVRNLFRVANGEMVDEDIELGEMGQGGQAVNQGHGQAHQGHQGHQQAWNVPDSEAQVGMDIFICPEYVSILS